MTWANPARAAVFYKGRLGRPCPLILSASLSPWRQALAAAPGCLPFFKPLVLHLWTYPLLPVGGRTSRLRPCDHAGHAGPFGSTRSGGIGAHRLRIVRSINW